MGREDEGPISRRGKRGPRISIPHAYLHVEARDPAYARCAWCSVGHASRLDGAPLK